MSSFASCGQLSYLLVGSEEEDEHETEELELCAALIALQVETVRVDRTGIRTVRGGDLCIADISEDRAWCDYRFRKADLYRLYTVLRFPTVWECKNRSWLAGETALLLMLRRLRYPGRLWDLEHVFEREYTQLSGLFAEVMDFMSSEHGHLLTDNLAYWEPLFEAMSRHVEMKGGVDCEGSSIFSFLDGTIRRSCRQRDHDDLQRDNYSGEHKAHGLSFQSLVLANGMIGHLYGPESGRRHDSFLLRESGLNDNP